MLAAYFIYVANRKELLSSSSSSHSYALSLQSVLQKPCQGNFRKFQESGESRFGGSEKDSYFLKISKWQHKPVRDNKR